MGDRVTETVDARGDGIRSSGNGLCPHGYPGTVNVLPTELIGHDLGHTGLLAPSYTQ